MRQYVTSWLGVIYGYFISNRMLGVSQINKLLFVILALLLF